MGTMPWAVYLWPGLPGIWKRGDWSSFAVSVGFAVLLNLALIGTFVWTELEQAAMLNRTYVWLALFGVWLGSAALSFGWERRLAAKDASLAEDASFGEALDQYLQQNWYEAERTLARLLRRNPRDVDARLMLATVLRHTGRLEEASGELDRLDRIEGSRKWAVEIDQERHWLSEAILKTD
ncbi:MAG TPA: hypothetical protein DD670_14160, partial [Planctomycetaceae bacterium]|nr:hypothetical protein [Planctomycetaceae bacterium]